MKHFAVAGSPILHSKSPQVFNHFFSSQGVDARYTRILAESAKEIVFLYKSLGLSGMSVTAPYKTDIMPLLDYIDEQAMTIGSVNTVVERNGKLCGYNTDYKGIVDTLKDIKGKKVLLLGAGGASKAVAYAVTRENGHLCIFNRTKEKAQQLAEKHGAEICVLNDLEQQVANSDIIINTLPSGIKILKDDWLHNHQIVFDAVYHQSAYESVCQQKNIVFYSGRDWLVNQAIPAYRLFLDIPENDNLDLAFPDLSSSNYHDKIAFIGFMGTGKSMIGEEVSKILNTRFFCTDSMITLKERKTINAIFEEKGETYFRQVEKNILELLSSMDGKAVISSGGGMVLDENNRQLIKNQYISICLYSSPESIINDVDPETRPLLKDNFNTEAIQALLSQRNSYYLESADIVLNTGGKDSNQVANLIVNELKKIAY